MTLPNLVLALALYTLIGLAVLHRGMAHLHHNSLRDTEFRRMARADLRNDPAMVAAKIATILIWPYCLYRAYNSRFTIRHAVQ